MNEKIIYIHADEFDEGAINCGFSEESDYIITDGVYDFGAYLQDQGISYEYDETGDIYFLLEKDVEDPERTGEAYQVIRTEPTDEDLIW